MRKISFYGNSQHGVGWRGIWGAFAEIRNSRLKTTLGFHDAAEEAALFME